MLTSACYLRFKHDHRSVPVQPPVMLLQIWFPRAVDAIKENVEECLAKKVAGEEYTYAFSTEWRAAMVRVLTGFMDGPLHNKFGERIRRKLGDNLQMVCSFFTNRSCLLPVHASWTYSTLLLLAFLMSALAGSLRWRSY